MATGRTLIVRIRKRQLKLLGYVMRKEGLSLVRIGELTGRKRAT